MNYAKLVIDHAATGADMTIAALPRSLASGMPFGALEVNSDNIVERVHRVRALSGGNSENENADLMANIGAYVFNRKFLVDIADRADVAAVDFERDIIPKLIQNRYVSVYDIARHEDSYWRGIDTVDDYYEANMDLVGPNPRFNPDAKADWPIYTLAKKEKKARRLGDSRIAPLARIVDATIRGSVVSGDVLVEPGAIVENCVLQPGARVGQGARLRDTVVREGCVIPPHARIGHDPPDDSLRYHVTPKGIVVITPRRQT
jgi:glucose-1-phosphate adenylyltransferase